MKALDTQVGGSHYKDLKIQPMEYSMANGLDACQHTIVKYVTRFRQKGGIDDLRKARHCIDMLIEFELEGVEPAPPVTSDLADSFDEDRIDIIAASGGSGEHYDEQLTASMDSAGEFLDTGRHVHDGSDDDIIGR